ncbi:MAG: acyl-CoA dehydrogenase family protein, partial [Acidimicrobiales bacterium]
MAMHVNPIPTLDERTNDIRMRTAEIVNEWILPNEARLWNLGRNGEVSDHDRREAVQLREEIKEVVWNAGLWAPHLPQEYGGMGLDFLTHAYMNEVLAYGIGAASLFGVVAPNSGNQSILVKYGTEAQKQQWLLPLIAGEMQSGFSMTEPANAGSDPRSITTSAVLDGDHWVINGHKWFTSNGIDADFFIVMARVAESDEAAKRREGTMAQFIVPTATKGVNIVRGVGIWGRPSSDHCEVIYDDVRIPQENILGRVGEGHQAAQNRLGAGRI